MLGAVRDGVQVALAVRWAPNNVSVGTSEASQEVDVHETTEFWASLS